MPDLSISVNFVPGNFTKEDLGATIRDQMFNAAPSLGTQLEELVRAVTPVLTGTLQESVTYEVGDESDEVILEVFYDEKPQFDEYGRTYDVFQEGPPLGRTTYTNSPHQMLQNTADGQGMVALEVWAKDQCEEAVKRLSTGNGIII